MKPPANWLTCLLLFVGHCGLAQSGTSYVSVYVEDSLTNLPVELMTVRYVGLRKTLSTNSAGRTKPVSIETPTTLTLRCQHINYLTKTFQVTVLSDTTLTIQVRPYQKLLNEVVVRARGDQTDVADPTMSAVRLTARQINNIPSMVGERDLVKALLLLPGVKTETEGSSSFNVRGGGSDQNLLLLNKIPLYSANHLFGLLSSFNTDIVRDVSLIKGAFPAQYGGRLSSVLDVTTQEGDYEHMQLRASASLIASRASIELPLIRQKLSLLVAGRRTYLDALFPSHPTNDNPSLSLSFYDLNARLGWRINERNKLSAFVYADKDRIRTTQTGASANDTDLAWRNQLVSLQWDRAITGRRSITSQVYLSDYDMGFKVLEQTGTKDKIQQFGTSIRDLSWRTAYEFPQKWGTSQVGLQYTRRFFQPNQFRFQSIDDNVDVAYAATRNQIDEIALYTDNQLELSSQWQAALGFRGVYYAGGEQPYFSPEPRLSMAYRVSEDASIKLSFARMQQTIHQLSNPGLGIPIDLWVPANRRVAPQTAHQIALGYVRAVPKAGLFFSGEVYYKQMQGIISYLDGKSSSDVATLSPSQEWEKVVTTGRGWAWGAELLAEKKQGDLTGWVGYTLAYVRQQFDALNHGQPFYPRYDKRHELSVVANYKLSSRWRVNASWVFSTGQPITLPVQAYSVPGFTLVDTQIPTRTNGLIYVQGDRNAFRMIPFHRLNVAIQSVKPHRWGQSTFEVGLYNAYNRRNPYYYFLGINPDTNTVQLKSMSLFPLLPGISYSVQFNTH